MRREDRLMRRLWRETRDWSRSVRTGTSGNLTAHRDGLNAHPEEWE